MERIVGGILVFLLGLSLAMAEDKSADKPTTPEEQYKSLVK